MPSGADPGRGRRRLRAGRGRPWAVVLACLLLTPAAAAQEDPAPHDEERAEPAPPLPAAGALTAAGMLLPRAPEVAPGAPPRDLEDPLAVARVRWNQGDAAGTVAALSPWLESRRGPWGRTRTAGHLLLGLAHLDLENWNLASTHFYRVRRADGPLAPYGAWYEALVDHYRGRHHVAVSECKTYRERWPAGPQADECLLLIGDAYAAAGNRGAALGSYQAYLEKHPDTPREEEIRLSIAQATATTRPDAGIRLLQQLAVSYSYPSTALAAEQALAELAAQGHDTALPTDPDTRMRQAESLRRAGRFDEAWAAFEALSALAEEDERVAAWAERAEDRFAWGTRRYDVVAESLIAEYEAAPHPDVAWRIFSAWRRDGQYDKALAWGERGLEEHGSTYRWRIARDDVAWAALHAGAWANAAERFGELKARGGQDGRKYAFYEAYSLHRGGEQEAALAAFDEVIRRGRGFEVQGWYWKSKALAALGQAEPAREALAEALSRDETGWYALVEASEDRAVDPDWRIRDGRWHGGQAPVLPSWARPEARPEVATRRFPDAQPLLETAGARPALLSPARDAEAVPAVSWEGLRWDRLAAADPVARAPAAASDAADVAGALPAISEGASPGPPVDGDLSVESVLLALPQDELGGLADALPAIEAGLPSGYQECTWYDPAQADEAFHRFSRAHESTWPGLAAAYDLAIAGLYTEAGIELAAVYREWDTAREARSPTPRQASLRDIWIPAADWRQYFLFVRDAHLASRFCYGLWKGAEDDVARLEAYRLAYPVVRAREVWDHGRTFDVDPYLVLGIMRQESRYKADALSHAGAIGLVQVMPRTGARVAAMLGETRYSPGALQDPSTNLRYGTYYLSRLLDRFDGVFPLAVASYNGGPHNMSRWYRQHWESDITLAQLVEQIEYDETRDYVKKVSGYYARYVELYEPEGARVILPTRPRGDDASVIDF